MKLKKRDDPVFWDWYKEYSKNNIVNKKILERTNIKEMMFISWRQAKIETYNDNVAYVIKETNARAREWARASYDLCIEELKKANLLKKDYKNRIEFKKLYVKLMS